MNAGSTPTDKTPNAIITAINNIKNSSLKGNINNATLYKKNIASGSTAKISCPKGSYLFGVFHTAYDFGEGTGTYSYYARVKSATGVNVITQEYFYNSLVVALYNNSSNDYIELETNDYFGKASYWVS